MKSRILIIAIAVLSTLGCGPTEVDPKIKVTDGVPLYSDSKFRPEFEFDYKGQHYVVFNYGGTRMTAACPLDPAKK